jgi:hypothetical protein
MHWIKALKADRTVIQIANDLSRAEAHLCALPHPSGYVPIVVEWLLTEQADSTDTTNTESHFRFFHLLN